MLDFVKTYFEVQKGKNSIATYLLTYLWVGSSLKTMSRTCRASCGASAWWPAKNWPRWCKSARAANLITTLNDRSFLQISFNYFLRPLSYLSIYYDLRSWRRSLILFLWLW
jgi:hypothetical protein